jgi:anti-sigma regulatory factor (Ser/Thr protein kinase)
MADRQIMRLVPERTSPMRARQFLLGVLEPAHVDRERAANALLVSEIVTNAVLHAASEVVVSVGLDGGLLEVAVSDRSRPDGDISAFDQDRLDGWGLEIVSAITDRWGYRRDSHEDKTVWFEIALA